MQLNERLACEVRAAAEHIASLHNGFVPGTDLAQALIRKSIPGFEGVTEAGMSKHVQNLVRISTVHRRLDGGRRARGYPLSDLASALDALE
jgi:hypothetical protein